LIMCWLGCCEAVPNCVALWTVQRGFCGVGHVVGVWLCDTASGMLQIGQQLLHCTGFCRVCG
jgi:hypothetical protein